MLADCLALGLSLNDFMSMTYAQVGLFIDSAISLQEKNAQFVRDAVLNAQLNIELMKGKKKQKFIPFLEGKKQATRNQLIDKKKEQASIFEEIKQIAQDIIENRGDAYGSG